jgi:hypothetical protein
VSGRNDDDFLNVANWPTRYENDSFLYTHVDLLLPSHHTLIFGANRTKTLTVSLSL